MKFQPGDKVTYIDEGISGGPETGKVYKVSKRCRYGDGVHLEGFAGEHDWWYDYRFELAESPVYVVLTEHTQEIPSGAFNPRLENFTKAQKFTKEELKAWIANNHDYRCEIFKCVPVKVTVRSIVEIEE